MTYASIRHILLEYTIQDTSFTREIKTGYSVSRCCLQALGSKLTRNNLVQWRGNIGVERILHARVPIIKFRHATTGVTCVLLLTQAVCSMT